MLTRFAPSPTGYLHLGHAKAAKAAFDFAARHNGSCLLRIEDIDHTRCRAAFTQAIYDDLSWLGFNWPAPRLQSEHMGAYRKIIENLAGLGLAYPCIKTRREISSEVETRGLKVYTRALGEPSPSVNEKSAAWRLSIQACRAYLGRAFHQLGYESLDEAGRATWNAARPERFGDIIIGRRDIGVSYHIAVTHDDALQNITHIIRGEDLKTQTDIHVLLQALMGWPVPIYHHHSLLCGADGEKLAKRNKDLSIAQMRVSGLTASDIWAAVHAN